MIYPNINYLYSYRPPNCYTRRILEDGRLWASKPSTFNDPFDCDLEVTRGITEEDVLKHLIRKHGSRESWCEKLKTYVRGFLDDQDRFTPEQRARVDEAIQKEIDLNEQSGVVCLCELNDSILMWSHYAHHHSGICIEFVRSEENDLGNSEICSPVEYSPRHPIIDFGRILEHQDGGTLNKMMRTKAECWSYEREWRVIRNKGDATCPLPGRISRVIFGLRAEEEFRVSIEAICEWKQIPIVKAERAPMEFRIIVPV